MIIQACCRAEIFLIDVLSCRPMPVFIARRAAVCTRQGIHGMTLRKVECSNLGYFSTKNLAYASNVVVTSDKIKAIKVLQSAMISSAEAIRIISC